MLQKYTEIDIMFGWPALLRTTNQAQSESNEGFRN